MKKIMYLLILGMIFLFTGCVSNPSTTTTTTGETTTTTTAGGTTTTTTTAGGTTTTTSAGGMTTTTTATTSTTTTTVSGGALDYSISKPTTVQRLIFIHHSVGENWLTSGNGNLGTALNANNYYVNETYYDWDAVTSPEDNLGDNTDTSDWPLWFNNTKMPYVYTATNHQAYTNTISDPGGENTIIMFKSCYPNSEVDSSIDDEKAIYNSLLTYFAAHTNKLFVLITPPGEEDVESYAKTKELCDWLVSPTGWLSGCTNNNVAVYDFYCVLSETDSHHRVSGGTIERVYGPGYDGHTPYWDVAEGHPNTAGSQKATTEFLPMLNYFYNRWKGITN